LVQTLLALCKPGTVVIMVQKWRDASKESMFLLQVQHPLPYAINLS
jgi:hypothetical protein